jgi:23S rRNA pseudouridine1911/1915/1917 synthase
MKTIVHRVRTGTGERLDKYLSTQGLDLSRSQIQKLLCSGRITVGGKGTKAHHKVRAGEDIQIEMSESEPLDVEPEEIPLKVLYEDGHLLVVDKPPGMVVHPACGHNRGTLVNALLGRSQPLSLVGGPMRPGIVHRLDKNTSGLLVVAKDNKTHRALSDQLSSRSLSRTYWALVWGHLASPEGMIQVAIGRSATDRKKMAVRQHKGREAVTRYRVRESLGPVDFLELKLVTGRTHQIRVHLFHVGHPVVGDPDYGGRRLHWLQRLKGREREIGWKLLEILSRQALHAGRLEFTHPASGKPVVVESPLPLDFTLALETLRRQTKS